MMILCPFLYLFLMIFNRVKLTLLSSYIRYPLVFSSVNRFNNHYAFSTLKDKAEKYLCSAVTYHTLYDIDIKTLYSLNKLQPNNGQGEKLSKESQKLNFQPFSLRQRVIHNLNSLNLSQENNREEVRKIFEIGKGLVFQEQNKPSKLIRGGDRVQNTNEYKFVFNPTVLFRQLSDQVVNSKHLRKFLTGKFGVGKSSNQLLLSHLTTMLYLFRKQGQEAQAELQTLLKNNEQILKQIMSLSQTETSQIQNKNTTFVQLVKGKFYEIPLVYFYALPQNPARTNTFGLQRTDFLKYFTEEQLITFEIAETTKKMSEQQLTKINQENAQVFLKQLQSSCRENQIKLSLIIDQLDLFFGLLDQKQRRIKFLRCILGIRTEYKYHTDKKYSKIINNLGIYSLILNHIHSIFTKQTMNLTLSAVQDITTKQITVRDNRTHHYASDFFDNQASFAKRTLTYSQQSNSGLWQKQMDIVFVFQFERKIHCLTSQLDSKTQNNLPQNYKQKIAQVVRQLKYRYHKEMAQKTSKKELWSAVASHQLIRQNVESIDGLIALKRMFQSIIDFLIESGKLMNEQQLLTLKENLNNTLFQKMKGLKSMIKQGTQLSFQDYLYQAQGYGSRRPHIYLKQMFYMRLFDKVLQMVDEQENQKQVIIQNELLDHLLEKSKISIDKDYQILRLFIDKDFQEVIEIDGKKALKNRCSLKELKKLLEQKNQHIYSQAFYSQLSLEDVRHQDQCIEKTIEKFNLRWLFTK